jgi:hypothetical protein
MARPVMEALNEQQGQINGLKRTVAAQTSVIQAQAEALDRLIARDATHVQRTSMLTRGLYTLSTLAGGDLVARVTASMSKRADQQNPAQPVMEPPAQPAPFSTEETEMPEAFADVTSPGLAPGTTNDVAADSTSTVYTPGTDIDMPALNNLIDVTAPVDGTQNPRPLSEVKTHTDVRVGDPMNAQTAWPVQGPWANAQRTSSKHTTAEDASRRTMASLRLAKLHLAAGMAEGDEYTVAAHIERDASRSTPAIEAEIENGERYTKAAKKNIPDPEQTRGLVPRTASAGRRSVPSMQQTASAGAGSAGASDDDASDLFD